MNPKQAFSSISQWISVLVDSNNWKHKELNDFESNITKFTENCHCFNTWNTKGFIRWVATVNRWVLEDSSQNRRILHQQWFSNNTKLNYRHVNESIMLLTFETRWISTRGSWETFRLDWNVFAWNCCRTRPERQRMPRFARHLTVRRATAYSMFEKSHGHSILRAVLNECTHYDFCSLAQFEQSLAHLN